MRMLLLLMMMMVTGAQLKVARVKRQSYGGMGGGGYGGGNYGGGNSYGGARAYGGGPALGRANVDVSFLVFLKFCISCLSLDKCPFSISSTIEHVNGKDGWVLNIQRER